MASPPEHGGAPPPQGGGGIGGHLKRHWPIYTIGIGAATLVVILIANYNNSNNASSSTTGAAASTGVTPGDQSGSALLDYDLGNLQTTIQTQSSILQNIADALKPTTTPTTTGGGTIVPNVQSIFPWLKNTPGASNNFWVYTTQQGDTAQSLATKAGWGNFGPSYFEGYRNNNAILQNIGYDFSHPNSPLPVGTKVSL